TRVCDQNIEFNAIAESVGRSCRSSLCSSQRQCPRSACENGAMAFIGSASTRLVILRGDSASGKTTTATALRSKLGPRVALIHQDYVRRELLQNADRSQRSADAAILIVGAARQALDLGYDVILDGIFNLR